MDGTGLAFHEPIVIIRKDYGWFMGSGLVGCHHGVSDDNDNIADLCPASCSAVQTDYTRAAFAFDDIRDEPLTVVIIDDMYLFVLEQSGSIHKIFINGNATNIIQLGLRDFDAMEL